MPESDPKPTAPKREPAGLTSEYHKARKQLLLWSAILFIWELIGIDLETAQEAGGNTGALIRSIRSPQAVPWALLILVVYFVFKLRIEWRQCNEARRRVAEARQDYYSACIIALGACLLYFGQTISRIQFADFLRSYNGKSVFWGTLAGVAISLPAIQLAWAFKVKSKLMKVLFRSIIQLFAGLVVLVWGLRSFNRRQMMIGFLVGIFIAALMELASVAARRRAGLLLAKIPPDNP